MESSLLKSDINSDDKLSIEDKQVDFFPTFPLAGAMEMFKPLLEVMKECIGNHPVACAEKVEKKLKEEYPDSISKMNLISFAEYVYLARQRGLPIRCSQSNGKPLFMWFSLLEEAKTFTTNDDDQNGISHQSTTQSFDTQSLSESDSNESKDGGVEDLSNEINTASSFAQLSYIQIVGRRIETSEGSSADVEQSFELVSSLSRRHKTKKHIDDQTKTILNAMIRHGYKFCFDPALFKFVGIFINFVLSNPGHSSIVSANWVYKFIQRKFPTFLGSPQDSNSTKDKAYSALLGRANHQEWEMPIVFIRRRFEIDISKLRRLIDLYKKDM